MTAPKKPSRMDRPELHLKISHIAIYEKFRIKDTVAQVTLVDRPYMFSQDTDLNSLILMP